MFRRWIKILVYLLAISGVGLAYVLAVEHIEPLAWTSLVIFIVAAGLLVVLPLARSIKQGRLVVLKPFFKKIFEGMTFFKWGILIIGFMIAGAILSIAL